MDSGYNGQIAPMSLEFCNDAMLISRKYSRQFWEKTLELARFHGWKPLGSRPPVIIGFQGINALWDGTYLTNDGQTITSADALALAEALERALDAIPDEEPKADWNPGLWRGDELPEWLSPSEKEMIEDGLETGAFEVAALHPHEFFAGAEKRALIELIRFCKLGSFKVL